MNPDYDKPIFLVVLRTEDDLRVIEDNLYFNDAMELADEIEREDENLAMWNVRVAYRNGSDLIDAHAQEPL